MPKAKLAPLPPDTMINGYRIVRQVSEGGFSLVYLALDSLNQQVAIKEYLPSTLATRVEGQLAPQVLPDKLSMYRLGLKSFFEEGRSLAQVSHPSVVSVLNFFRQNETVYLVMNYLQGATLQDFIMSGRQVKGGKAFSESTIRSVFDEILQGLRVVHQNKMLHLDIKPGNLFITDDDTAVLIDFGATREVLHKDGSFTQPMYTPGFAAPEMYRRESNLGPWTDVYAIGGCMYSMMLGYPPPEVVKRRDVDPVPDMLAKKSEIYSDKLLEVIEWCMALDPLARPQSVFELQSALANYHDTK
jgi:eukaryotic-like serine/threonine-protein kinase